jgi:hypothetical protein
MQPQDTCRLCMSEDQCATVTRSARMRQYSAAGMLSSPYATQLYQRTPSGYRASNIGFPMSAKRQSLTSEYALGTQSRQSAQTPSPSAATHKRARPNKHRRDPRSRRGRRLQNYRLPDQSRRLIRLIETWRRTLKLLRRLYRSVIASGYGPVIPSDPTQLYSCPWASST